MKARFKRYFYETFRPRGREDYRKLFTCGKGEGGAYPWFYMRVLLCGLLCFGAMGLAYSLSSLNFPTVIAAGGAFADLTLITLLYELYPQKDIPFLVPVCVFFVAGFMTTALCDILYGLYDTYAPFAEQAWIAFVEESVKAAVTIFALLILKRRDSYFCLLIGAAVGGGYSAFENMWYMYTNGFTYYYNPLSSAMYTAIFRAIGTPFSHAAWAAAFGWALSAKNPLKKWQTYAVFAFDYVMHFFVNFPLMEMFARWKGYPISAVTGVLSLALFVYLIVNCRRAFSPAEEPPYGCCTLQPDGQPAQDKSPQNTRFSANVLGFASLFCLAIALFGPTCVYGGYLDYKYRYCDSFEECLAIAQSGLQFTPDFDRPYAEYADISLNYSYTVTDGELVEAVQKENYGGYDYYFTYFLGEVTIIDDNTQGADAPVPTEKRMVLNNVQLEYGGNKYSAGRIYLPADGQNAPCVEYYFCVNPDIYGVYYIDGRFEVQVREQNYIRKPASIAVTSLFGAGAIGCAAAYAIIKIRLKRRNYVG